MGTRVCSSKGTWPGQRGFTDPEERQFIADEWEIPRSRLPDDPGPGPRRDRRRRRGRAARGVLDGGDEPGRGMPDASEVRSALDDAFLVAQDAFRTETVELADVVLPAATWGESEGTVTNMERRISRVRAATETSPKIKQDLDIIVAIGAAIDGELFPDPRSRRSRCSTSCAR